MFNVSVNYKTVRNKYYFVATCPGLNLENGDVEYHLEPVNGEYPTGTLAFFVMMNT